METLFKPRLGKPVIDANETFIEVSMANYETNPNVY